MQFKPEELDRYLSCCLVGTFNDPFSSSPNPQVIQNWFLKRWRLTAGLRVIPLTHNQMLFELPSRQEAERIIVGDWFWNERRLTLEWWSPVIGAEAVAPNENQKLIEIYWWPVWRICWIRWGHNKTEPRPLGSYMCLQPWFWTSKQAKSSGRWLDLWSFNHGRCSHQHRRDRKSWFRAT